MEFEYGIPLRDAIYRPTMIGRKNIKTNASDSAAIANCAKPPVISLKFQ